ncbi:MAG: hypothetical protein Q4B85_12545 [Lachnospiraceae bacterium]|nr:hypothetical protein [Lachnospiraceae bacterium]
MNEKSTRELVEILGKTHLSEFESYCNENKESMNLSEEAFSIYMKGLLAEKRIKQQTVFLKADIPERYGYKLLSGEKHTKQRDIILRICYAAELSLEETQRALKKYGMPELYAKNPRDVLLMIIFNERPGSIIDVNELLIKNKMAPLRTSGVQE